MEADAKIAELRRRVRRCLGQVPGSAIPEDGGTLEGLDADITALEAELQASARKRESMRDAFQGMREQEVLRTVLESMVEGVLVADMEGRFLIFNTAAKNLMGKGPVDTDPSDWSTTYGVFRSDGETLCPTEELPLSLSLQGAFVDDVELIVRSPERAGDCHITATARPLFSEHQQIGAVVVFHDITSAKMVEHELRFAREQAEETARVKSAFLANMSHEIRTPLTAVLGFADLLMERKLGESDKLNYIQAVRRNGEHLLALINDVLDLSKLNSNQFHVESVPCSLHHVVHEVASVMRVRAHDKGIGFEMAYETPIPAWVESDPMRVRQILLNLVSNAIKFTHHGKVQLTARCMDAGTDSARVEIDVQDSGIGLSAEEMAGLFQPFHQANPSTTRRYGGTGLGLTICRSLADLLSGEIKIRSAPGEGSTFTFILNQPVDAKAEMVSEPGVLLEDSNARAEGLRLSQSLTGRVLLAEDGLDNQVLISTILRRQGLEVVIAEDGEAAVSLALAARDENAFFGVILMDMQMPKLDGYGATAKLRSKGYSGPIMALTAHAMAGERERCIAAGCDGYLNKPIDRAALVAAVASHLRGVRGGMPVSTVVVVGTSTRGDRGESENVLLSTYADDPEMDELVAGFVERLPLQVYDIRSAVEEGDLALVGRLAHQLKGAAGSYGFMPVSHAAETLETAACDATRTREMGEAVQHLSATCGRVRHAR